MGTEAERNDQEAERNQREILRLPEYESVWSEFMRIALHKLTEANDPVFAQIRKEETQRASESPPASAPSPLDSRPLEAVAEWSLPSAAFTKTDVDAILVSLDEAAQSFLSSLMPQIFRHISDICRATGMTISAGGEPLSVERILDMLEKVDIDFDEDENPIMPQLVVHPDMRQQLAALTFTPEHLQRSHEIMSRKLEHHRARKRDRRIS